VPGSDTGGSTKSDVERRRVTTFTEYFSSTCTGHSASKSGRRRRRKLVRLARYAPACRDHALWGRSVGVHQYAGSSRSQRKTVALTLWADSPLVQHLLLQVLRETFQVVKRQGEQLVFWVWGREASCSLSVNTAYLLANDLAFRRRGVRKLLWSNRAIRLRLVNGSRSTSV